MGTLPILFLHLNDFNKIPVKIKQQQHTLSFKMPSDRRSDVRIFNMCCQIALCKYLDAYVNAMTRVSFVQSNRAQDLLDTAKRNSEVCAAFGWKGRGVDVGTLWGNGAAELR